MRSIANRSVCALPLSVSIIAAPAAHRILLSYRR
jgi:hypothetical protein